MIRKSRVCSSTSSTAGPISTSGYDKAGRSDGEGRGSCPPCWLAPGSSAPRCSPFDDLGAADRAAGEDQWNDGQRQCEGADAATVPLRGNVEQCTLVAIRVSNRHHIHSRSLGPFPEKDHRQANSSLRYSGCGADFAAPRPPRRGSVMPSRVSRTFGGRAHPQSRRRGSKDQLGAQDISVAGAGIRQSA